MVSIKDVAKEAGVAISTVSKVLNNYPNVSRETKEKVNRAIERLGFVPNAVAQALSSKQTGRVAVLINEQSDASIDEVDMRYLSGAITRARALGMDVITLFFSMLQDKGADEITTYLKSQSVEGLVIFGLSKDEETVLKLLERKEFKTVLVDAPIVNEKTSCVWVDQYKAQYDVLTELLKMDKPKNLLYLSGKENSFVGEGRLQAVKDLAKKKRLKLHIEPAEFSEKKAREIVFELARDYDAIACASDLCAIGAMRALTEMDIFRPVCGFDGLSLMGYAGKQMLTVKQDFKKIGEAAMEECRNLLSGSEGREVILPHEIVRIEYLDIIS